MGELRDRVFRGGMYLAGRQAIGTLINIGGIVLLTRALGTAPYGLYAAAAGIYVYLQLVGQWGINVYLLRHEGEMESRVWDQAFSLLLVSSVAFVGIAVGLRPLLSAWLELEGFGTVWLALLFTLPVQQLGSVPLCRLERALEYRSVAWIELIAQSGFFLVAVPLAFGGAGAMAPVIGWWVQQTVAAGLAFRAARWRPHLHWDGALARDMVGYGVGYSASIWVWQVRRLVNPLIVGGFLGASAVGVVALTIQIATHLSFVAVAAWRLATTALARVQASRERLARAVSEGMRVQALAVGPILVAFAIVAPWAVPALLGNEWARVVDLFPFVGLAYLTNAVFNLHSSALYVLRRNWDVTWFHIVHIAVLSGVAWLAVPRAGVLGYGWAELAALASYAVVHAFASARVGPLGYRGVPWLWLGFGLPLFWRALGPVALLGLPLALVDAANRAQVRTLVSDLRAVAYGR